MVLSRLRSGLPRKHTKLDRAARGIRDDAGTALWVHKTMNVLNAMPKSIQARAKGHLHDIWQAGTKPEPDWPLPIVP